MTHLLRWRLFEGPKTEMSPSRPRNQQPPLKHPKNLNPLGHHQRLDCSRNNPNIPLPCVAHTLWFVPMPMPIRFHHRLCLRSAERSLKHQRRGQWMRWRRHRRRSLQSMQQIKQSRHRQNLRCHRGRPTLLHTQKHCRHPRQRKAPRACQVRQARFVRLLTSRRIPVVIPVVIPVATRVGQSRRC